MSGFRGLFRFLMLLFTAAVLAAACTTPAPVDLKPGAISFGASAVADGSALAVSVPIQNQQAGAERGAFTVAFRLSQTAAFSPATDTLVGSGTVTTGIAGTSSVVLGATLTIPGSLNTNGNVYIYAVVDPDDSVAESSEGNNVSTVDAAAVVLVYDDENAARTYPLILQTCSPSGAGSADTLMGLYRNNAGTATIIESDVSGASDYSTIDRSGAGDELAPGTYSVVVVSWSGRNGPYAFLAGTANIAPRTFVELTSNAQDPGEPDDSPKPVDLAVDTTVPTAPASIKVGAGMNRYSSLNDWDWFTFVLP